MTKIDLKIALQDGTIIFDTQGGDLIIGKEETNFLFSVEKISESQTVRPSAISWQRQFFSVETYFHNKFNFILHVKHESGMKE